MHCQIGWVISDYTNLSRYITPVQSKPDSHRVPSPVRIQNTMMQDWRAQVGCVRTPTSLWHAANIGSHRNPTVGKEVGLTSCENVTLLCSCGRDLTYTHCWKISHVKNRVWNIFPTWIFSSGSIVIVVVIRSHWDAWVKSLTSHGKVELFALHSNEVRCRQTVGESSKELSLKHLPLPISFYESLQFHIRALRLRRNCIRK